MSGLSAEALAVLERIEAKLDEALAALGISVERLELEGGGGRG